MQQQAARNMTQEIKAALNVSYEPMLTRRPQTYSDTETIMKKFLTIAAVVFVFAWAMLLAFDHITGNTETSISPDAPDVSAAHEGPGVASPEAAQTVDGLHQYSPTSTNAFMQSCAVRGQSWDRCTCALNMFRVRYTEDEFQRIVSRASDETLDAGTKSWMENMSSQCSTLR